MTVVKKTMNLLPKVETEKFRVENRARKLAPLCFSDDWVCKEETGNDFGRDMIVELTENGEATNYKLALQIKGRSKIKFISDNKIISFPLPVRTISYGLREKIPFLLFLYFAETKLMYYLHIQDYMKDVNDDWKENSTSFSVHIPISNVASPAKDEYMKQIAKK